MEKVTCSLCKKDFLKVFSVETNQASDCASDIYEEDGKWFIISHYCSKYDTRKFIFQVPNENLMKNAVVCDECIEEMLEKKDIIEDVEYDYFFKLNHLFEESLKEAAKNFIPTQSIFKEIEKK